METSGTAMYLYSILKGVEYGWLDKENYRDFIEKSWDFLLDAIMEDGTVRDIIKGTGKIFNSCHIFISNKL